MADLMEELGGIAEQVNRGPVPPPAGEAVEADHAAANASLSRSVENGLRQAGQTIVEVGSVYAPVETALNLATGVTLGFPGYLIGGIGGLIARHTYSPETDPKDIAEAFANALTYHPMTQKGQHLTATANLPLTALAEGAEKAGHKVSDVTGSAAAGAITESTLGMLPFVLLGALGRRVKGNVPKMPEFDNVARVLAEGNDAAHGMVSSKLRTIYERTGLDPQAVYEMSRKDPTILQDLLANNKTVPVAIQEALPGRPYAFQQFDITKVGTGAGAQAKGHGIYLAQQEAVAHTYKIARGQAIPQSLLDKYYEPGKRVAPYGTNEFTDKVVSYDKSSGLVTVDRTVGGKTERMSYRDTGADKNKVIEAVGDGANLYRVELEKSKIDTMLDWDKPLSEQAPPVQEALKKAGMWPGDEAAGVTTGGKFYQELAQSKAKVEQMPDMPEGVTRQVGGPEAASEALNKAGVPGIKYLDQGSRGKMEGTQTNNFVIFDPKDAKITHKNGERIAPEEAAASNSDIWKRSPLRRASCPESSPSSRKSRSR